MSKYNHLEDTNYPKVGDSIDNLRKVKKVEHIEVSNLYNFLVGKTPPKDAEHLLIFDNPYNYSIKYLVWWKNI